MGRWEGKEGQIKKEFFFSAGEGKRFVGSMKQNLYKKENSRRLREEVDRIIGRRVEIGLFFEEFDNEKG